MRGANPAEFPVSILARQSKRMANPVNLQMRQKVYRRLSRLRLDLEQFLFPPMCTLCDAPGLDGLDLCAGCHADMPWNRRACLRCALPLPAAGNDPVLCGACLKPGTKPAWDQVWAPFMYRDPLPWLVTQLKFHRRLSHARLLGELMWRALADLMQHQPDSRPDIIMPVALHAARLRERGFNQAIEIARPLARRSGIVLDIGSLRRTRRTDHQSGLPLGERRRNMRGAFACHRRLEGLHIALLDDVMTSGNTVGAAATILKQAGAARVTVWVAARTPSLL